jgi:putative NADH-flavin reductase
MRRKAALALAVAAVLAGCGSASKPSYCADVANLKTSIKALPQTNVVQNGVSSLESAVSKVQKDAQAVVSSAKTAFSSETTALKQSLQTLSTTVKQAVDSPSAATLTQIPGQVSAVVTAAKNLEQATTSKCS